MKTIIKNKIGSIQLVPSKHSKIESINDDTLLITDGHRIAMPFMHEHGKVENSTQEFIFKPRIIVNITDGNYTEDEEIRYESDMDAAVAYERALGQLNNKEVLYVSF